MCGACAILSNAPDWVDRVGNPEGIGHHRDMTRGAERQRRVALVNLLLRPMRMRLDDLGDNVSLRNATGSVEIVAGLSHVWAAADRLSSVALDPLDPNQLASLESRGGA